MKRIFLNGVTGYNVISNKPTITLMDFLLNYNQRGENAVFPARIADTGCKDNRKQVEEKLLLETLMIPDETFVTKHLPFFFSFCT